MHKDNPQEFPSNHNVQAQTLHTKPWTFCIKNHLFLTEQQHRIWHKTWYIRCI